MQLERIIAEFYLSYTDGRSLSVDTLEFAKHLVKKMNQVRY